VVEKGKGYQAKAPRVPTRSAPLKYPSQTNNKQRNAMPIEESCSIFSGKYNHSRLNFSFVGFNWNHLKTGIKF
jgi:hypothetical protein